MDWPVETLDEEPMASRVGAYSSETLEAPGMHPACDPCSGFRFRVDEQQQVAKPRGFDVRACHKILTPAYPAVGDGELDTPPRC